MTEVHAFLTEIDFERYQLTVSWGQKPTGGYSIAILEVQLIEDSLQVLVETHSPGPEAIVTTALTYPKATTVLTHLPQGILTPIVITYKSDHLGKPAFLKDIVEDSSNER